MSHETNQTQIQVNTDETAIRADLGQKLGALHVENAVLKEQVQALAVEKIHLEDRIQRLEAMLQPAEAGEEVAPEVIDTPVA